MTVELAAARTGAGSLSRSAFFETLRRALLATMFSLPEDQATSGPVCNTRSLSTTSISWPGSRSSAGSAGLSSVAGAGGATGGGAGGVSTFGGSTVAGSTLGGSTTATTGVGSAATVAVSSCEERVTIRVATSGATRIAERATMSRVRGMVPL